MPSNATRAPLYGADAISTNHHVNHINDTMEHECDCGWLGEVECLTEQTSYTSDGFNGGHTQSETHGTERTTEYDCPKCGQHNEISEFTRD
jgi:hypothetical protein